MPLLERQPVPRIIKYRCTRRTYLAVLLCTVFLFTLVVAHLTRDRCIELRQWAADHRSQLQRGAINRRAVRQRGPDNGRSLPQRGAANIFFIETTCAIENVSWSGLHPRQACAVESAARHHPGRPVYVLHTCEAPASGLWLPAGATAVHMPLAEFLSDTPLYTPIVESGALAASRWPVHHASDVMRLAALWKYGGLYLDLDFVILRNLSEFGEDWIGAEDDEAVANGAVSMSSRRGSPGREVVTAYMEALRTHFDGQQWTSNGGEILRQLLAIRCNTDSVATMTDCRGFRVLPPSILYPVPYLEWYRYFLEEDANDTLADVKNAFAIHVWNKFSTCAELVPHKSAYATLARENCPDSFGDAEGLF